MKEFTDKELQQRINEFLQSSGTADELGPITAEVDGPVLVVRYTGTGERTGKFKSLVKIPSKIGDDIWNEYVEESTEIDYWTEYAVIVPVVEAYWTNDLDRPADSDGFTLMPVTEAQVHRRAHYR
ncbi:MULTISPECIES: hypothetical protein [Glutamicibacter]|uniref:Uncharacterized protein n=2 Tax=Glutamicibacter halophytocola TaxID=1933880 RepID=A0AA94Y2Q4_9MICC|nr:MULTISPECIES: hypothetical protein [Glutamicibacter]MBF6671500.1 hypothetical protein [Glutamicibacter sp. FBE19]NQD40613.1 hypothetical protein [Glutamicibacter halophytocola]UUX60472.1 hypothetical protein NUH22_07660 [Glutamicibacter halophytocola]